MIYGDLQFFDILIFAAIIAVTMFGEARAKPESV